MDNYTLFLVNKPILLNLYTFYSLIFLIHDVVVPSLRHCDIINATKREVPLHVTTEICNKSLNCVDDNR